MSRSHRTPLLLISPASHRTLTWTSALSIHLFEESTKYKSWDTSHFRIAAKLQDKVHLQVPKRCLIFRSLEIEIVHLLEKGWVFCAVGDELLTILISNLLHVFVNLHYQTWKIEASSETHCPWSVLVTYLFLLFVMNSPPLVCVW